MKKMLMVSVAAVAAAVLAGCGDKDIDLVKKGVFPDDPARTVEQRISAIHKELKWTSYTTENNYKVVEATAVVSLSRSQRNKCNYSGTYKEDYPHDGDIYSAKFVINSDHKSFVFHDEFVKGPKGKIRDLYNCKRVELLAVLPRDKAGVVPKQD